MKNIHILKLPTDKPSRLYLTKEGFYFLLPNIKGNDVKFQNIYITNDEEIENCWFVNLTNNEIGYIKNNIGTQKNAKKIILTTDQDLIKDGVQSIDDEFLEWFVKNPSCEWVEVQKWFDGVDFLEYKIIIPKEEPKANFDRKIGFAELRAKEMVRQTIFGKQQETLEEAAERYIAEDNNNRYYNDFIAGAKWQQERSYSEEDLKSAFFNGGNMKDIEEFNHWFEQFKKK